MVAKIAAAIAASDDSSCRGSCTSDAMPSTVAMAPDLRLVAIDGLPLAGNTTLADRLATAIRGACVFLDDFIKPEREWRWRDRPSFPFDFIRLQRVHGRDQEPRGGW